MASHQPTAQPRRARAPHERHTEVQAFLNQLASAITVGDGKRVASLWGIPAVVIGAEGVRVVTSHHEVERFFAGASDEYDERGIVETRAEIRGEEWISDRLVIVKVRWPCLDSHGREVAAEASDYTLRRNERGELEVRAVLMRGVESQPN